MERTLESVIIRLNKLEDKQENEQTDTKPTVDRQQTETLAWATDQIPSRIAESISHPLSQLLDKTRIHHENYAVGGSERVQESPESEERGQRDKKPARIRVKVTSV
jgi:hypothetical protein